MSYQDRTGALMANSHPGSYCGQDAYSDMLITEKRGKTDGRAENVGRVGDSADIDTEQCGGGDNECPIKTTLMR